MEAGVLPGRIIGHYQILEPLGAGGMGAVYKTRDTRLGRVVALKVMRDDRTGAAEKQRFLREAQTASALNHPNILTIYEIGNDEGVDYIAMEFIEGGTLADVIASGPLTAANALPLVAQVAEALVAAHAASIVHRDLKPSNIMMAASDRVKLVDFGLAKFTGGSAPSEETSEAVTAAGVIVGTAPYMSPEQASGRAVDARSDLFSVGTILYEMLSGHNPFRGDSGVSTLAAILKDTPPAITGISTEVARLVDRCLAKDVAQRFQSAVDLKAAIHACLAPAGEQEKHSIAVLPFTSMTEAMEDEYFCEGLAEEIINQLTRIPGLRVIARTSAFAIGRMGLEIRETAARLGVDTILEGSVRREGRRVRVAAQLVSANDASHLWSERYDRELTDVLRLEDEIAAEIAAHLRLELTCSTDEPQPVRDTEAYAAHLEGRYYFARGTPEALFRAKECYERAIARDPAYALAYDSLAELHWYLGFFGGVPPREAFSMSVWHALRAIELDDTLAQAHALLGMLRKELDYNWPEVDRELHRALQLNRDSALVRLRHAISGLLPHGRVDEAFTEIEGILQTDPLSLPLRWWLAIMAYLARRPERAIDEGRHMIALDPTHFFGHWSLGIALIETGVLDDAVSALERAHELSGGIPFTAGFLALAYGRAARTSDARQLLDHVEELAMERYVPPTTLALGYIGLGEWESALCWMDKAIDVRDPIIMPIKTFPFLDPLRGDARFHALLQKMHLE